MRVIFTLLFSLIISPLALAQHDHDQDHAEHGFLVMGEGEVHLYHLARFNSPHRYQALIRVSLTDSSGTPIDLRSVPNEHPQRTWSVLTNERWALTDIQAGSVQSFRADLYAGYLRDQASRKLVLEDINVTVETVEYFAEILPDAVTRSEYRMLMTCDSVTGLFHGAHLVEGRPSFEEIVRIDTLYSSYYSPTDPDAVSVVHSCNTAHKGTIVTLGRRNLNQPLASDAWVGGLDLYSPAVGDTVRASGVTVLTDSVVVNR